MDNLQYVIQKRDTLDPRAKIRAVYDAIAYWSTRGVDGTTFLHFRDTMTHAEIDMLAESCSQWTQYSLSEIGKDFFTRLTASTLSAQAENVVTAPRIDETLASVSKLPPRMPYPITDAEILHQIDYLEMIEPYALYRTEGRYRVNPVNKTVIFYPISVPSFVDEINKFIQPEPVIGCPNNPNLALMHYPRLSISGNEVLRADQESLYKRLALLKDSVDVIRMETFEGNLFLMGKNDAGVVTRIVVFGVVVKQDFSVIVPKQIIQLVKFLSPERIDFYLEGENLILRCGGNKATFKTTLNAIEELPLDPHRALTLEEIESLATKQASFPVDVNKFMVTATAKDSNRLILQKVAQIEHNGKTYFAGADGYRLHVTTQNVTQLTRKDVNPDDISGQFPDIFAIIPNPNNRAKVTVRVKALKQALLELKPYAKDSADRVQIEVLRSESNETELRLFSRSVERGDCEVLVDAISPERRYLYLSLNYVYLLDILNSYPNKGVQTIDLYFDAENPQTNNLGINLERDTLAVIMPMNIKDSTTWQRVGEIQTAPTASKEEILPRYAENRVNLIACVGDPNGTESDITFLRASWDLQYHNWKIIQRDLTVLNYHEALNQWRDEYRAFIGITAFIQWLHYEAVEVKEVGEIPTNTLMTDAIESYLQHPSYVSATAHAHRTIWNEEIERLTALGIAVSFEDGFLYAYGDDLGTVLKGGKWAYLWHIGDGILGKKNVWHIWECNMPVMLVRPEMINL